ncbi:MAG: prepilin-type N-terminal cleavage/methylation domain-containing protein, partial [Candidatus Paceibacterota bacterium]
MAIRNIAKKIRKKLQKGFTLVEIMVTIAIVGLLAALIFVGAQSALSNGRDSRRQGELSQVKKSLQAYYLANGNQYPLAAEAISLEEDNDANGPFAQAMKGGGYLPIIPRDPKHNVEADYSYKYIATTTAYYTLCAKSESKGGYLCVSGETGVALEDDAPAFGSWGGGSEEEVVVSVVPQISAGGNHTCFVKSNGTVWCWGNNSSGELGINNTTQQLTPVQVLGAGGSGYLTGVS